MELDPQISLFESYLEGTLSDEESNSFERRLEHEPELASAFQLYKDAEKLLEESASLLLKEKMQELEMRQGGSVLKVSWLPYAAVAIITLLLVSAYFGFFAKQNLNSQEILGQYFEAYPASNLRGSSKMENPFNLGMTAYIEADYPLAISSFTQVQPNQAEYIEAQLYLGNAYLGMNNYAEAISALSKVYESGDSRFSEAAAWYLLLGYVGGEQAEKFQKLSAEIVEMPGHAYTEKVLLLQEKWKRR